jgi:hypothetical protein
VTRILASAYFAAGVLACLYALYRLNVTRVNSEFAGLPLLLLALPWSAWPGAQRPHILAATYNNAVLISMAYVALNTVLIVALGAMIGRARRTR